jgi:hypothetical protein
MVIKCVSCGKEFQKRVWNAKSCSPVCNLRQWRLANHGKNNQIKRDWRRRNGALERGSEEHRQRAREQHHPSGELHPLWKGGEVCYRNLHKWVERWLGKPDRCELEDDTCIGRYEWSNISGEYHRDLDDWQRLCKSHHRRFDNQRGLVCQL